MREFETNEKTSPSSICVFPPLVFLQLSSARAFGVFKVSAPGPHALPQYQTGQRGIKMTFDENLRAYDERDLFRPENRVAPQASGHDWRIAHKTPLHPNITGRIRMDGFHLENCCSEPAGVYVAALVYVPTMETSHPLCWFQRPLMGKFAIKRFVKGWSTRLRGSFLGYRRTGGRSQFWDAKSGRAATT